MSKLYKKKVEEMTVYFVNGLKIYQRMNEYRADGMQRERVGDDWNEPNWK